MNNAQPPADITAEAVLFTRQFTTLISAGVSLVRALLILEAEAPAPYAAAMASVRAHIEAGSTLSEAIADLPALFPPFYRVMIRAGEIGGVLDITLARAADLLQEEWTLSQGVGVKPLLMAGTATNVEWDLLSPAQRTLQLLLFCSAWGSMLSSGVPIVQAMEVAAECLHPRQREEVLAARDVIKRHGTNEEIVTPMTFLPLSARTLIIIGCECGELDTLLLKAAELYRHQLLYQRQLSA